MLTYNVEDLKLKDSSVNDMVRYTVSVSDKDKIELIDAIEDGYATKLFTLKNKYDQDLADGKIKIRETPFGNLVPNTNSLIAWIKRNDSDHILDNGSILTEYTGRIRHAGLTYISISDDFHQVDTRSYYYTFPELLDELFLALLKKLRTQEEQYFKEHDEYEVKKQTVRDFAHRISTTFNYRIIFCSSGSIEIEGDDGSNTRRQISIQELDELISKYEEVENLIHCLSK